MTSLFFWICVGIILYTYLGFPIILYFLVLTKELFVRQSPNDGMEDGFFPSVTLLISAYNEEKIISEKILNSLELNYPKEKIEIIITSDGSDDRTTEIVKSFENQGIKLLFDPERRGKMAAINRAMPETHGEIIIFSDANNMYHPNAIMNIVAPFQDAKVGGTNGAKHIIEGDGALGDAEGLYWRYESYIKKLETRLFSSTAVAGEIFAIRKELFEKPPDNIINDDFYMAMRLIKRGYKIVYADNAESYERVSPTSKDEITRRARINAGRYQAVISSRKLLPFSKPLITWQVISHKYFRLLVPFGMIGAFLSNLFIVIFYPENSTVVLLSKPLATIFFVMQIVFYGTSFIYPKFDKNTILSKVLYLPTFLVNSNFAALKGAFRYFAKQQSTKWERVSRRD